MKVRVPEFTTDRLHRRVNLMDADRARFYYWNLASVFLTCLPIMYLLTAKYEVCSETAVIAKKLDPHNSEILETIDTALYKIG